MNTAIIYESKHHGNTKKLVDAIARTHEVTLIDALTDGARDLSGYDLIGFASGVYGGKFGKGVLKYAQNHLPADKPVFLLYTCGSPRGSYTAAIGEIVRKKGSRVIGEYGCPGFDTFGPFKLVGGIAKGHPNAAETDGAAAFFDALPVRKQEPRE
ncbi:flavodoxin family protein [Yanshouia hominis]|uniref:Flavodoxin family protein n=1 Tax=Yanshouia hominis TaxID=2763673 RepID=A0ABR7NL69_9FIRM|nr:flavodoxin family protein [Yanshouia hominis]MBC8577110.1 flavodoxin family protein [Yanshouia hominis]